MPLHRKIYIDALRHTYIQSHTNTHTNIQIPTQKLDGPPIVISRGLTRGTKHTHKHISTHKHGYTGIQRDRQTNGEKRCGHRRPFI